MRSLWLVAALVVACALLLLPVALVPVPPLVDYPNHLACLWLIAGGAARPPASHFYAVDWSQADGISACSRSLPLPGICPSRWDS